MRQLLVVVGLCGPLGCGGSVATSEGTPATGGAGGVATGVGGASGSAAAGAAAQPAAGGTPDDAAAAPMSEPLDDPSFPAVPEGSGAFIWSRGIGNWFVTPASGAQHDAGFEILDGVKVWETRAELGSTDLWVQLHHPDGAAIDVSDYTGIAFDVRTLSAETPLIVVFNANGDVAAAEEPATAKQRFTASENWQSFEVAFEAPGRMAPGISSVDFVVSTSEPVELQVRNLALKCKAACP